MPDMREILNRRAEANAEDGYEAKHARAMEKLNNGLAPRVSMVRVVGPAQPQMSDIHRGFLTNHLGNDMTVGHCRFCDPDPEVFRCRLCDWETPDRWRMWVHNVSGSKLCRRWADKKARKWASKV